MKTLFVSCQALAARRVRPLSFRPFLLGVFAILWSGGVHAAPLYEDQFDREFLGPDYTQFIESSPTPKIFYPYNVYMVGPDNVGRSLVGYTGVELPEDFGVDLIGRVYFSLAGVAFNIQENNDFYALRAFNWEGGGRVQLIKNVGGVDAGLAFFDTIPLDPDAYFRFAVTSSAPGQFDYSLRSMDNTVLGSGSFQDLADPLQGGYAGMLVDGTFFQASYLAIVPEPSSVLLLAAAGGLTLGAMARRRFQTNKGPCKGGWAVVLGLALFPAWAGAEEVELRQGETNALVENYAGTESTMIIDGQWEGLSYGEEKVLHLMGAEAESRRRILLRFDLTALHGRIGKVDKATLHLFKHLQGVDAEQNCTFSVYEIAPENQSWSAASWLSPQAGGRWAGAQGLRIPGIDYVEPPLAEGVFYSATSNEGAEIDEISVPADLVERWLGGDNAGLLLVMDDEDQQAKTAYIYSASTENDVSVRPSLRISYSPKRL